AAAATTVDRLATLAVTCCTCCVIVSTRASCRFTPSRDTCTWPRVALTFSTVVFAFSRIGPVFVATTRSISVVLSTVRRGPGVGRRDRRRVLRRRCAARSWCERPRVAQRLVGPQVQHVLVALPAAVEPVDVDRRAARGGPGRPTGGAQRLLVGVRGLLGTA